ncbi:unnamed protein product [Protopolystoma xenopodis]|uniref:Uncharacterized protein n=1 Tax=Protopolystoma xenopodis TaxID=117903 RepID=A0A3S5AYJ9_9PLAT|nr:unnamed protein product [Protopolystoma xenopodis]
MAGLVPLFLWIFVIWQNYGEARTILKTARGTRSRKNRVITPTDFFEACLKNPELKIMSAANLAFRRLPG